MNKFNEIYNKNYTSEYFSPGRVNLIGEHTDYNNGFVFPMAINVGTKGWTSPREDSIVNIFSENFPENGIMSVDINNIPEYNKANGFMNFVHGVITEAKKLAPITKGFDLYIKGSIPTASGLSSSASFQMLLIRILNDINEANIDLLEQVKITQRSENNYIGAMTGIMDQYAIGFGKKNKAIHLNVSSLQQEYIDFNLNDFALLIIATNKQRELSESKYNERVLECGEAVRTINANGGNIKFLADLTVEEFKQFESKFDNQVVLKRAKHVIEENERTMLAKKYLASNNIEEFGKLMYASHESLRDQYEVTGEHLDAIYDFAKANNVAGARMTGAGFGGCGIVILKKDKVEQYKKDFSKYYEDKFGFLPTFVDAESSDGVSRVK